MLTDTDIRRLGDEIRRLEALHSERREAADRLVADIRSSGVDPVLDSDAFARIDAAYREADELAEEVARLRARRDDLLGRVSHRAESSFSTAVTRGDNDDPVARLFSVPEYRRLVETGTLMGEGGRVEIPAVQVVGRDALVHALRRGYIFHATADVAAIVEPDDRRFPPVELPLRRAGAVLALVPTSTTESDTVNYVEETTRTDMAAETAPGTAAPEATYAYTLRTVSVRDITHFTPAHRRNLADAGQVRALLEGRLAAGVQRRLEDQIVNGSGVDPNIRGVLNTTGIGTVARGTEPRVEALHKAITNVRVNAFVEPEAILVHPTDYEELIFEKDSTGNYLLGPAAGAESRTVWGVPLVVSTAIPQNTALVGAWSVGAQLWLRSGVTISATDSHADFFAKRMVAIMAELRAAFAAWQPKAFCSVTNV